MLLKEERKVLIPDVPYLYFLQGPEFVALELKRKRDNQRRYVANIKRDPGKRAAFLQMRAKAGREYRKQEKATQKPKKKRLRKTHDSH